MALTPHSILSSLQMVGCCLQTGRSSRKQDSFPAHLEDPEVSLGTACRFGSCRGICFLQMGKIRLRSVNEIVTSQVQRAESPDNPK